MIPITDIPPKALMTCPPILKRLLLGNSVLIPVHNGRLALGTWQGIYLCEHRNYGGERTLMITLWGE